MASEEAVLQAPDPPLGQRERGDERWCLDCKAWKQCSDFPSDLPGKRYTCGECKSKPRPSGRPKKKRKPRDRVKSVIVSAALSPRMYDMLTPKVEESGLTEGAAGREALREWCGFLLDEDGEWRDPEQQE